MIYLLDTSALSALMREDARITQWLSSTSVEDRISMSVITRGEVLFGLERLPIGRRRGELESKARQLLDVVPSEPVTAAAGDVYAKLKAAQERLGASLAANDLWIAATAITMNAMLVTCDSDFRKIPGLASISW